MAGLTKDNIRDIGGIVANVVGELVPGIIRDTVPDIVRQETNDIRSQLGQQGMAIKATQSGVSQLKKLTRQQGILLEDINHRFEATSELLHSNLNVKKQVDGHEICLSEVETTQSLLKTVVTKHSQRLKTKPA